jgi:hypothetical protein
VTYSEVNLSDDSGSSIRVVRSTDGGATFSAPTVVTIDSVRFPQVVVSSDDGTVSAIWVNRTFADIRMSQSTDHANNFGAHEVVTGGNLIPVSPSVVLNGGLRAASIPMARYNGPAHRICVVYYGYLGTGLQIDYTFKPGCTTCNFYGWAQPIRVSDSTTNDRFLPAIDFNITGNLVVPSYDRRDDGSNLQYAQYFAYITADGMPLQANVRVSAFLSNPNGAGPSPLRIGDYQDAWDDTYPDGESVTSAWIGINPGPGEDYLSRIFY